MTNDPSIVSQISGFIDLFEKWNRSINLSAASSRRELDEHVDDSMHVVSHLRDAKRVLDVGSGGGFPVVVAAICLPSTSFVALEPIHKKHAFLRTVARSLALSNLECVAERIEDHAVRDYDVAMSRATLDLLVWLTIGSAYVRAGGRVIGFEAIQRSDVPAAMERHSYVLGAKPRAIVINRR